MSDVAWTGRPCIQAFWGYYVVAGLLLGLSIWVAIFSRNLPPLISTVGLALSSAGIVAGCLLAFLAFLLVYANKYEVADGSVRRIFKLMAVKVDEAPIEQITNVVTFQSVPGRILGYGHIRFDTAGTPFPGITFYGVRNPLKARDEIAKILEQMKQQEAR